VEKWNIMTFRLTLEVFQVTLITSGRNGFSEDSDVPHPSARISSCNAIKRHEVRVLRGLEDHMPTSNVKPHNETTQELIRQREAFRF
jgi:hypothetical protein